VKQEGLPVALVYALLVLLCPYPCSFCTWNRVLADREGLVGMGVGSHGYAGGGTWVAALVVATIVGFESPTWVRKWAWP
jgi:hypothetical protein